MELIDYQFIWFSVFVILITGYAVLDGFDLGVGILHLLSKEDRERRLMLNSIGPVWDGNEVWLVTAGGALFAGFPIIYATLCSGFYIPTMALLGALIFRAVSIEVRSKSPQIWWRWLWDILFALASFLITFILGLLMGNLIRGVPLDAEGEFSGHLSDIMHAYPALVGLFTTALFTMHGAIYLMMKTEGDFHEKMRRFVNPSIITFIMLYAATSFSTLIYYPHMVASIKDSMVFFVVATINVFAIANIPREIQKGRDGRAFISSSLNIICLMALYGLGTYPNVVRDIIPPHLNSLTIFNSSSSLKTLQILLLIALIGIPLVVSYTISVYWIFRGKVRLEENSY